MNKTPLEYDEACTFADWLELKGLRFSHIPSETFTKNWGTKMKNKRMGVHSGVPDYIVITPKGLAFVELKRQKGGVVSDSQKEWIYALNACKGVEARVAYGAQDAIDFVNEFL